jgi:hypothetical protein
MTLHDVAEDLRRHGWAGLAVVRLTAPWSDEAMVDLSLTCHCCGQVDVTPAERDHVLAEARDTKDFLTRCHRLGQRHHP